MRTHTQDTRDSLTPEGALVGFVVHTGDASRVVPCERLEDALAAAKHLPGAERMGEGDGFMAYELVVPVRDRDGRRAMGIDVRGNGVTAYKYKRKHHGTLRPLEQSVPR